MWRVAVTFVHERWGITSVATSVDALRVLDSWWQKVDGVAYQDAINVCIEAVQGERPHEDARLAFIAALIEGGIRSHSEN